MPLCNLWVLDRVGGVRVEHGELSYKPGDCLAVLRSKISVAHLFDVDFEFWSKEKVVRRGYESTNMIEDYGGEITILLNENVNAEQKNMVVESGTSEWNAVLSASFELDQLVNSSAQGFPSSDASNSLYYVPEHSINTLSQVSVPSEMSLFSVPEHSTETPSTMSVPVEVLGVDALTDFKSRKISSSLAKLWVSNVTKLITYMKEKGLEEHKWVAKTWDEGNDPQGCVTCLECNNSSSGSSLHSMDKTSVNNCFMNYRSKHVLTEKHLTRFKKKRKREDEVVSVPVAKHVDERGLVNIGLDIVKKLNEQQNCDQETFLILGNVAKEPCQSRNLKVCCSFCAGSQFSLVPAQKNLQHNLEQHLGSQKHVQCVHSFRPSGSGGCLLSGRPGRPANSDRRDRKQPTMHSFFNEKEQGAMSSSSSGQTGMCQNVKWDSRSLLCWGVWRDTIMYAGEARYVKALLGDTLMGGMWFPEPNTMASNVYDMSSESYVQIDGTFRHKNCNRVSRNGGGFLDLTCEQCHEIVSQSDFRLRVFREEKASEKRGNRDTGMGRRLEYLTVSELSTKARVYGHNIRALKGKNKQLSLRVCRLQAKIPNIREMIGPIANSKDIYKFCSTIVAAHRKGVFGGKSAIWDFLKDTVLNLNRPDKGNRYSKGTKTLMQALYHHGGRRVIECLHSNMLGPSINTLQAARKGMLTFRPGLHKEQFEFVASVYAHFKKAAGITTDVPCILAEDETSVKKSVRWLAKTDVLIGFCGAREGHSCDPGLEIKVGNGEEGLEAIVNAFEHNVMGCHARVIMVNPLVENFPVLCLMASCTCNRFKSDFVRQQWDDIFQLWNECCRESVGPMLGHASDGDPRRRKPMIEQYVGKGVHAKRQSLGWEGWNMSHSFLPNGDAYGLHDQDFIHVGKKLINPLDSSIRVLHLGAHIATLEHLQIVYDLHSVSEHGLRKDDLARTDRQNWASAQRLCGRKVLDCLKAVRERQDARVELTLGTEMYLSLCGDYLDVFLNVRLTLRERIVLCARVSFFFRLWRLWITKNSETDVGGNTQVLTTKVNMISDESFYDIQISCHFVVYLIVYFRDHCPHLPVPIHLTGSDACEQFFSKVGGMKGHERAYDFAELIDAATGLNRLAHLELSEGIVSAGKSHKKYKNVWMALHPLEPGESVADLANFSEISHNAQVVDALQEGLEQARNTCIRLEMCPTASTPARNKVWWDRPWQVEREEGFKDVGLLSEIVLDENDEEIIEESFDLPEINLDNNSVLVTDDNETENPEFDFDDGASDIAVAQCELRHVFGEMASEAQALQDGDDLPSERSVISPMVTFEGRSMYKSTLVSQLVGNPVLSKDRLRRVRQTFYFNNLVDRKEDRFGEPQMLMGIGADCAVLFTETVSLSRTRQNVATALKGKGKGKHLKVRKTISKSSSSIVSSRSAIELTAGTLEKTSFWLGRVQKIRKRYLKCWGRSREPIDLLDRPALRVDAKGSSCQVLFNYFRATPTKGKYKYVHVDPQWIDVESVLSTVTLRVNPEQPTIFVLDPPELERINAAVLESNSQ